MQAMHVSGKKLGKLDRMTAFDYVNYAIIILFSLFFIYPVILTASVSISDPVLYGDTVVLFPKGLNFDSYLFLLNDSNLMRYYANSVFYAVSGTIIFLLLTALMAYPLMLPGFKGKKALNIMMVITIFFGGGLIPTYFVIRALGMIDTIWVMIIPGAIGAYNVIIFRTFFASIPAELRESAHLDGAGHFRVLFGIILPVSKPLIATFALISLVGKWNDFLTPLIFLRDTNLMPMQILLRKMLVLMDFRDADNRILQIMFPSVTSRSMKSAAAIMTILPIMCVYPFLQKYFAKGIMIGSLKS